MPSARDERWRLFGSAKICMRRITIYAIKINWSQSISSPSFHMHTSQQKVSPLADTSFMEDVGKCSSNRSTRKFLELCAWFGSSFVTQLRNFWIWKWFSLEISKENRIECQPAMDSMLVRHKLSWIFMAWNKRSHKIWIPDRDPKGAWGWRRAYRWLRSCCCRIEWFDFITRIMSTPQPNTKSTALSSRDARPFPSGERRNL